MIRYVNFVYNYGTFGLIVSIYADEGIQIVVVSKGPVQEPDCHPKDGNKTRFYEDPYNKICWRTDSARSN